MGEFELIARHFTRAAPPGAAVVLGVGDDGALLVHTAGGMQAITSSEISVRPTAVRPV